MKKNRTTLGIICIILAVVIVFLISPFMNRLAVATVNICTVASDLKEGAKITDNDIRMVEVNASAVDSSVIRNKSDIVGKFAKSDLYKGDYYTNSKLEVSENTPDLVLSKLDGSEVAISFTIDSFAAGLSGKLENGDIISVIVTDKDKKTTSIPAALTYLRVITTTTSGGVDEEEVIKNEDGTFALPATVTVLATPYQAQVIASYEGEATMHASLVFRGEEKDAKKFLDKQTEFLKKLSEPKEGEDD